MRKQKSSKTPPPPSNIHNLPNIPNVQNVPNQTPNFLGSMIQGMALGTGSSIGHKMVDSVFSETKDSKNRSICDDVDKYIIDFNRCMSMNDNFHECNPILDMYLNCKKKTTN